MSAVYTTQQGPGGVFQVVLTKDGFRIRHGRHGNFGGGIWSAGWRARRAADHLSRGETIPADLQADRHVYT